MAKKLTKRELEVMGYIVEGFTNSEIASVLGISIKTVNSHRSSIMSKAECRNVAELVKKKIFCDINRILDKYHNGDFSIRDLPYEIGKITGSNHG